MAFPLRDAYERFIYSLPHHFHEPPDIKHHRRPAPGLSFTSPNLPALIADCIALGEPLSAGNDELQGEPSL